MPSVATPLQYVADCDLLLGDHLTEKSETVKWVDISMPNKRSRRLKDLTRFWKMLRSTTKIVKTSFKVTFWYYPQRPNDLKDVCLYHFAVNR